MIKIVKASLAFILSFFLLWLGFNYFLSEAERSLFFSVPFSTIITSVLISVPGYVIGGVELRYLYGRLGNAKLDLYDAATMPFVTNLWGFILPFQGSFIYTTAYVFAKYRQNVSGSVKVYVLSMLLSLSLTGIAGLIYFFISDGMPSLFVVLSGFFFIAPFLCYYFIPVILNRPLFESEVFSSVKAKIREYVSLESMDLQLFFSLTGFKLAGILLNGGWLYWVAIVFGIDLSLMQVVLILLLMNIAGLIKITPGNIGVMQLATGGIAVLVGATLSDGFLLSSFQFLTNIICAFSIGGFFTFVNFRYLNWSMIRSAIRSKNKGGN